MDGKATFTNRDGQFGPILAAFARAIALARNYEGATAPNPPVGCVLLDAAGQELAAGAHRRAGLPHAEADAIARMRALGLLAKVESVVVTLGPCNHHGRTPPCTDAILNTGAQQVWIACRDPNDAVRGGGVERLRAAGRDVRLLSDLEGHDAAALLADAERLLAPFRKRRLSGLPFITVKQVLSASGSMVPPPGHKTFASATSLDLAHGLRRRADAILTGSGTILADNPLFTVRRVADHPSKRRMLVILDRRGRVSQSYYEAAQQRGFDVHLAVDLDDALERIGAAGALEVLVEAGPTLTAHMLSAGLWDEHVRVEVAAHGDGTDRVTLHRNLKPHMQSDGKGQDVFRHH